MPFTIYDHREISGVLEEIVPVQLQLLNHFGNVINFDTPTIDFDKIADDLRVSVFVAPEATAKNLRERGFSTKTFIAPYTKQKASVTPQNLFKRSVGERINAFASPEEKYNATLVDKAMKFRNAHKRLMEWSAAQLLINGSYTASGELHPSVLVDFERKSINTRDFNTLNANGGVGKRVWGSTGGTATVSPVADLEEFIDNCQEHIEVIYMSNNAWTEFKKDPNFKTMIDTTYRNDSSSSFELYPKQGTPQGLKYRGRLESNNTVILTYNGTYQDPVTGAITQYIPSGYVIGVPSNAFGHIAYGAIQHGEAGYQSVDEFWNMWMDDELGVPYLQFQSAPMLAHTKIDSTFAIKVAA